MEVDFTAFTRLKGEFEAEGLTRQDVAAEALFAARHGAERTLPAVNARQAALPKRG